MKDKLLLPTCLSCNAHLLFDERLPKKQNGVLMKPGDRYCLGSKKPIRFGRKDPKIYPPKWCPKRKSSCEVRVYGFKSVQNWYLHDRLCRDLGRAISPNASDYCLEEECTTDLTPSNSGTAWRNGSTPICCRSGYITTGSLRSTTGSGRFAFIKRRPALKSFQSSIRPKQGETRRSKMKKVDN